MNAFPVCPCRVELCGRELSPVRAPGCPSNWCRYIRSIMSAARREANDAALTAAEIAAGNARLGC